MCHQTLQMFEQQMNQQRAMFEQGRRSQIILGNYMFDVMESARAVETFSRHFARAKILMRTLFSHNVIAFQ